MEAEVAAGEAEIRLEKLPEVHARRHAERVEDDVHRPSVGKERHVAARKDARNDALVSVAAGHLVADGKVLLVDEEHPDLLDDFAICAEIAEEPAFAVCARSVEGIELRRDGIDYRRDPFLDGAVFHVPARIGFHEGGDLRLLDLPVACRRGLSRLPYPRW